MNKLTKYCPISAKKFVAPKPFILTEKRIFLGVFVCAAGRCFTTVTRSSEFRMLDNIVIGGEDTLINQRYTSMK
jgi:hypothetical protein